MKIDPIFFMDPNQEKKSFSFLCFSKEFSLIFIEGATFWFGLKAFHKLVSNFRALELRSSLIVSFLDEISSEIFFFVKDVSFLVLTSTPRPLMFFLKLFSWLLSRGLDLRGF